MTPNTIYRSFSMDYTMEIHHALRADGQIFTRTQYRDPRFGYRLSPWRQTSVTPDRCDNTGRKARLPKEGKGA